MKRFAVFQLPIICYAVLIFAVSSLSRVPTPDLGITFADKIAHFIEYGVFVILLLRAFSHPTISSRAFVLYAFAVIVSIVFAALDEYHQKFVPGRTADLYDLAADSLGILIGSAMHFRFYRARRQAS